MIRTNAQPARPTGAVSGRVPGITTQIFIGLLLGILVGYLWPGLGVAIKPLADAFLRMIKMIIAPLLFATLVASGAMLVWPLLSRRVAGGRELGTLGATQLINTKNALLLDVRETKEIDGGKLPNAVHVPLSQLANRGAPGA